MAKQTDPATGKSVPDTATTYERAKPDQESPSQSLNQPKADAPQHQDQLARNASPSSQKRVEQSE